MIEGTFYPLQLEACSSSENRAKPKVLSIQYVYYFRAYQRQRSLHGVGVITKKLLLSLYV